MKRAMMMFCIALAGVAVAVPAQAQIAAAIGKPLPSPDMPAGTVSVRVVAGSPSSPITGTDVTLLVNGTPRVARTDSAGRAFFKDLPAGAKIQAKVTDDEKQEHSSDAFDLPGDSGVRVMLSTLPWNPGAGGGGPMAGGAMPNPRQMSGQPRPDENDAPGTLTVRLSYDDFKDAPPVDVPVALVGYTADDKVTFQSTKSDKDGRAIFKGLDRTGATAYVAMTQLPRNNAIDRLASVPVMLDPRAGVRMILSSEKRTSTAPAVDDLAKIHQQDNPPPAGKIRVELDGAADQSLVAQLVDAEQHLVLAKAKPTTGAPDPSDIQPSANFEAKPDIPAGTLRLVVHGGSTTDEPLAGVGVHLIAANAQEDSGTDQMTDATGTVEVTTPLEEPVIAVVTINGKQLRSPQPLDLTKTGGVMTVTAKWPSVGKPELVFDLVPRPGQVVYVETQFMGQTYRSLPFQPVPERGTRVTLLIYPRLLFKFSLSSSIDDEYLGVRGRFDVYNSSWAPYVGGPDGLVIPLPKHFVGGQVAPNDQGDVAVAPGEGFRIMKPIAPGQRSFVGAFSLPVEHGEVMWDLDLPFGAFNSGMEIAQVPGMQVSRPSGLDGIDWTAAGQTVTVPQGTFYVIDQISILPKQSMLMRITGLPAPAAWRIWMPRIIGVLVVIVMIGGVYVALTRKRLDTAADTARQARRQKLLDELVELEKAGKNEKRREQIMAELEKLWDDAA